jgi:hypothetical protein
MSFFRLIYLSSLIGGWSAFIGWFFTELVLHWWIDEGGFLAGLLAVLMATLVAAPIGGGVNLASGLGNPRLQDLLKRLAIGAVGGFLGGLLMSIPAMGLFALLQSIPVLGFLGRVVGWSLIGVGIGVGMGALDGIFDRSWKKLRNGLLGGFLGGLLGGFTFVPISWLIGSPMSSRAFAFVLLGLSIGLFVGLVQVLLKEAWLSVEEGFRPGRQLILTQDLITMGTSEKASLIFIAYGAKGVEPIHVQITRSPDGRYVLQDNQSRTGTLLNGKPIAGPMLLRDGDTIQFGVNVVRFRERVRRADADEPLPLTMPKQVPTSTAIQATPPAKTEAVSTAVQATPPAKSVAVSAAALPAAGKASAGPVKPPPVAPAAEVEAKPQEGRCPVCDKKMVGIPGKRRCTGCFTTF